MCHRPSNAVETYARREPSGDHRGSTLTAPLLTSVVDSPLGLHHHHATMQVVEDGARQCRLVWIADLAPDSAAPTVEGMMAQGALAMQHSLAAVSR